MTRGSYLSTATIVAIGVAAARVAGLGWAPALLLGALPVAIALGAVALLSAILPAACGE